MILGRQIFAAPRWNGAAHFPVQRQQTFKPSLGAPNREFRSRAEVSEYEAAFTAWTPTSEVPAVWFSAAWLGHRDAEATTSARTLGAAS